MANWFYYNEKGEKISVTGGQLKGLAKTGRITADTVVETETGKTAMAGQVKGLTFIEAAKPAEAPAAHYFYYDVNGIKQGPINPSQLKALAERGIITPGTAMETDTGKKGTAGQIPGLFATAAQPATEGVYGMAPVPVSPKVSTAPPIHRAAPQNVHMPAAESSKSSHWITLIGIVAILVVAGIGWAIITTTAPTVEQTVFENDGGAVAEEQVNASLLAAVEQEVAQALPAPATPVPVEQAPKEVPFTAAERAEIDKFCAEFGDDVKAVNEAGRTLLHDAVMDNQSVAIIRFLIAEGADIDARDIKNDGTPLHWAAYQGNVAITQLLVSKGAEVDAKNKNGATAFRLAVEEENLEVARLLASAGADVNVKDKDGVTLLTRAMAERLQGEKKENAFEVIKFLVSNGADVNEKLGTGTTWLHVLADKKEEIEIARIFVDNGANVNAVVNNAGTPLHFAATHNNVEFAKVLVSAGADVTAKVRNVTPLDSANVAKSTAMVKYLSEISAGIGLFTVTDIPR